MLNKISCQPSRLLLASLVAMFVSLVANAQPVKITIKCDSKSEVKSTKQTSDKQPPSKANKAVTPKFELNLPPDTRDQAKGAATESGQPGIITLGCVGRAIITAGPSPFPNQTVVFNVWQDGPTILSLKLNPGDAYTPSLQVPISLDGNGYGVSPEFYVRGNELGSTVLLSESPGFTDSTLDIFVVACNCPFIPVSSAPRN